MFLKFHFILGMPTLFGQGSEGEIQYVLQFFLGPVQNVLALPKLNWIYKTFIGNSEV